jgi:putative membrane protein
MDDSGGSISGSTRLAERRTTLAVERTRMALERTLMAWVRTATALISFGFSVYKAVQYLQDNALGGGAPRRVVSPREFAIAMIALGIGALALATLQHQKEIAVLYRTYGGSPPRSIALFVAACISCIGVVALVVVLLRQ